MAFTGKFASIGSPIIYYDVRYVVSERSFGLVECTFTLTVELINDTVTWDESLRGKFFLDGNETAWFTIHDKATHSETYLRTPRVFTRTLTVGTPDHNILAAGGTLPAQFVADRTGEAANITVGELDPAKANGTISYISFYGPPAAPTGVTATRTSASVVGIGWTANAAANYPYATQFVQRSIDGTTWESINTMISDPYMTTSVVQSYSDQSSDSANPYKYRIAVSNGDNPEPVASAATGWTKAKPEAPLTVTVAPTVSSGSVTKFTLGFTRPASATYTSPDPDRSWENMVIERWDNKTNVWSEKATLLSTDTSWEDVAVSGDTSYQYRMRSRNIAGDSVTTSSSVVYTRPSPVSSVVATKADANITLTITNPSTVEQSTAVYFATSSNGSTWSSWTKATDLASNATTYTHAGLNKALQYKYYVQNSVTYSTTTLTSTTTNSNTVLMSEPPNAPTTKGSYSNRADSFDATDNSVKLEWTHSPTDGTAQRIYEVLITSDNWSTSTQYKVTSGNSYHFPTGIVNNKTYKWKVRTWGTCATGGSDGTGASAFSADATFSTNAKPSCNITTPSVVVNNEIIYPSLNLTVRHTYSDSESNAQTAHRTVVLTSNGSTILHDVTENNNATTAIITYTLTNESSYMLRKYVRDSNNLWSLADELVFKVARDNPPNTPDSPLTLSATRVDDSEVTVAWTAPATADDAISATEGAGNGWSGIYIWRWDNVSGVWGNPITVSVRTAGTYNGTVSYTDTDVEANRQYKYRIRSFSSLAASSDPDTILYSSSSMLEQDDFVNMTPTAPTNFSGSQPAEYVILTWVNQATYTDSITVERAIVSEGVWSEIGVISGDQTSYTDLETEESTTYDYRIKTTIDTLDSTWTQMAKTVTTKAITGASMHTINIPPVRKGGPRESVKDNIEAAEIGTVIKAIEDSLDSLNTTTDTYISDISGYIDDMASGLEAAKAKTETR